LERRTVHSEHLASQERSERRYVSGSSTGDRRGFAGVAEVPSLLSSAVEKVVEAIAPALRKRGLSR
jgi:hypothetical protein